MTNKSILFALRCHSPNGGCIKMRDYYNHASASSLFYPRLHMPADNVWGADNPWLDLQAQVQTTMDVDTADALFISGLGWQRFIPASFKPHPKIPVIYLVQGLFKLKPEMPHYQHFAYRAIRICVSPAISEKLQQLNIANGPVFTIPNCVDAQRYQEPLIAPAAPAIECLILGLKKPDLAQKVYQALLAQGAKVTLIQKRIPQNKFLSLMRKAKVTVYLPDSEEGFYLPALEGMGLGTIIICPDVAGNRHYCFDNINCLIPDYNEQSIIEITLQALNLKTEISRALIKNADTTYRQYPIEKERKAFLDILENIEQIW